MSYENAYFDSQDHICKLYKRIKELEELIVRAGEYLPKWLTPKDILEAIEKIKEE